MRKGVKKLKMSDIEIFDELIGAIEASNVKKFKDLFNIRLINMRTKRTGTTMLAMCGICDNVTLTKFLLENGADFYICNNYNHFPVQTAVLRRSMNAAVLIAEKMLEDGFKFSILPREIQSHSKFCHLVTLGK